jgi:hypothetical protein
MGLAAAGLIGAGAAVAVAIGGDPTPAAYAVQPRADGSVSVTISSLRDAAGLEKSLRAAGVPADVHYAADGDTGPCSLGPPPVGERPRRIERGTSVAGPGVDGPKIAGEMRGAPGEGPTFKQHIGDDELQASGAAPVPDGFSGVKSSVMVTRDGSATFTIDPDHLRDGQRLFITTSDATVGSIGMNIVGAGAPPCPGGK